MNTSKIRELAKRATDECIAAGSNEAWLWEDTFARIILEDAADFLRYQEMRTSERLLRERYNLHTI